MGEMISIPVEEYSRLKAAAEDLSDLRAYAGPRRVSLPVRMSWSRRKL